MAQSPYTPPKARIDPPTPSDQQITDRPKEIYLVIWLVVLSLFIGWLGALLSWDYQMSLQSPGQFFLGQLFGIAITAWIYYKIYQGRNWARILVLIFGLSGWLMLLVPTVNQLLAMAPTLTKVTAISTNLIHVLVLWLLFFSPGRHWFKKGIRRQAV